MQKHSELPLVRMCPKTGQYVPQLHGKDLPVTTFCYNRAMEIARAALRKAKGEA